MKVSTYTATYRYAKTSPQKARLIADLVRELPVDEALDILRFQPQRAARMIEQVIRSALANAKEQRAVNAGQLLVMELCVDGGPMMKRMRPKSRGSSSVILKRSSHIRVTLGLLSAE
jgi:ribosomal protein L22, bacterial type